MGRHQLDRGVPATSPTAPYAASTAYDPATATWSSSAAKAATQARCSGTTLTNKALTPHFSR